MKRRAGEERREKYGRKGGGGDKANPLNMNTWRHVQVRGGAVFGIEVKWRETERNNKR